MSKFLLTAVFTLVLGMSVYGQDPKSDGPGSGMGSGRGNGDGTAVNKTKIDPKKILKPAPSANSPLKILSKPRPGFTDAARKNDVQGTVSLMITFNKNGQIGAIKVVKGLPDGLTESAIESAKLMKFEPQRKNGKAITISKLIEYTFTRY